MLLTLVKILLAVVLIRLDTYGGRYGVIRLTLLVIDALL